MKAAPPLTDTAATRPKPISFLDQVTPKDINSKPQALKTRSEFALERNTLTNRLIFGLILSALASLGAATKWLASAQEKLGPDCGDCKISFLSAFYLFAFSNVLLVFVYFRNLNSAADKLRNFTGSFLGSIKALLALYFTENGLLVALFITQSYFCDPARDSLLLNTFLLALIQSTCQMLLNCVCSLRLGRVYREAQQMEEQQRQNRKRVVIYQESFCLDETKSDILALPNYQSDANCRRGCTSLTRLAQNSLNQDRFQTPANRMYHNKNDISNFNSISTDITKLGSLLSGDSIFQMSRGKGRGLALPKRRFNHARAIHLPAMRRHRDVFVQESFCQN